MYIYNIPPCFGLFFQLYPHTFREASAFGQLQRHLQLRSEAPATPSLKSASESKAVDRRSTVD